jgi:23S rRNA pseudouridine2604 synthase
MPNKELWPMRINKYLAKEGYATRKDADIIISKKQVFINGELAVLGDKVLESDYVEVRTGGRAKNYQYYAYNKPVGIVTSTAQRGEKDIAHAIAIKGVYPVGRLDKDSHGLIILTNDGRIIDRLLNPDSTHDKEYIVKTVQKLRPSFKEHMEGGMDIEGDKTRPCKVKLLSEKSFKVTLTEGKKHQIRRMVSALHNEVADLQRIRIMNIELGKLPVGVWRPIEGEELDEFMASLGL